MSELVFEFHQLCHSTSMPTPLEFCGQERCDNFLSQADAHHSGSDRQDIGIVVGSGHARRVQVVAQSCSHAAHLVGRQLLALTTSPEHDADICSPVTHGAPDPGANGGIVATLSGMSALILDAVAGRSQELDQMLFQVVPGMIRADRNSQGRHALSVGAPNYIAGMTLDPRTPVIIGVGQHLQRVDDPLLALAPAPFIAEAVRAASRDAGLSAPPDVDSLRVVGFLSWRYRDPARFIAEELGISTAETVITTMGGNSPQSLVNATAVEIQSGSVDLVVLCGGETARTRKRARAAEIELPWPVVPEDVAPTRVMGEDLVMNHEVEISRRIIAPVQIYPIFESALRAAAGRSIEDHNRRLGDLWSRFSAVAADNPYAWIRTPMTP